MSELPMLAIPSTGSNGRPARCVDDLIDGSGAWILDVKVDGIRAFYRNGKLRNRKGEDITRKFPEISSAQYGNEWFDGEIIARDGSFETTLYRESLGSRFASAAVDKPCTFVAFDLPGMFSMPWSFRRDVLEGHARRDGIPITPISADPDLWLKTAEMGMEGVIAKRVNARYQFGKRSMDWVKFKHLHRVSCIAVGYTPGGGSRSHMGAIQLALVGPQGPVSVGRCGSGFTEPQTHQIKALIDDGQMPIVEIECTHVTSGGTLRFPVFRGIRRDVTATDCTTDQLAAMPRTKGTT